MVNRRELFLGAGAVAAAATMSPVALSKPAGGLASDIAILEQAFTAMHPGLLRYLTPEELKRGFARLSQAWAADPPRQEAYLALSRFLSTLRCGHTYANFYNQSDAIRDELLAGRNRLPFHFRWIGDEMVVTGNAPQDLPRGSVIHAVNGEPASAILSSLMPYTRADGTNDAKRVAQLAVRGIDRYEAFDIFYGLTRTNAGQAFRLSTSRGPRVVEPIDLAQRQASMVVPDKGDGPQWQLAYEAGAIARLIMQGWAVYNTKWDWKAWLAGVMDEVASRGTQTLIVDLRGNEGGLDCGDEIIARLIDEPLAKNAYERRVRFRSAPRDLEPYLDTWDPSFRDIGRDATDIGGGYLRLPEARSSARAPILPQGPRFRGRLIVLVDATNSSATFQFASLVQSRKLGVLVGSPTGGNRRGINGGAFFFLRLPASGIEVDLPLIATFPSTPQPDAGVIPDVIVSETVENIADGVDAVLQAALELSRT